MYFNYLYMWNSYYSLKTKARKLYYIGLRRKLYRILFKKKQRQYAILLAKNNDTSYKIVVARYNENIDWLKDEMENCIIYNKGNQLFIENEIILENVGRESETYLNYIITNYHELPDIVVFTQGRISDHKGKDDVNYLINIKNGALINNKSQSFIRHYQTNNNSACWDSKWNLVNGYFFLSDNYKNNNQITFEDWFKKNINIDYPNPIYIYKNAIFAVKKELILKRALDYYNNLILEVNHHINSTEGHFFERSWYYIFN